MRTTLDIPEKLINEAMAVTGARTKTQLICEILQQRIDAEKRKRLKSYKGKIDLEIDLDTLRGRG